MLRVFDHWQADDYAALWIDGAQIINTKGGGSSTATVTLTLNALHSIQVRVSHMCRYAVVYAACARQGHWHSECSGAMHMSVTLATFAVHQQS